MRMRVIQSTFMAVVLCALCFVGTGLSQGTYRPDVRAGRIDAGTALMVRTNEPINSRGSDGRVYSGVLDRSVRDRNGNVAIPRGSQVELVVRRLAGNGLALDLDSVIMNGGRYRLSTDENFIRSRGFVPPQSVLTFRLSEPVRAGMFDRGYAQNRPYDSAGQSAAYRDGWQVGRTDFDRRAQWNSSSGHWSRSEDRRDYEAGYRDGYQNQSAANVPYNNPNNDGRQKPAPNNTNASISIGRDNNITWRAPGNANIYVQMDNEAPKLFASGPSGVQQAPWINRGHVYTFILKDPNGNEMARDQRDLR